MKSKIAVLFLIVLLCLTSGCNNTSHTGEVIQIDRWQKGYTATSFSDGNRAENEAIKDKFNEKLGVTKAQEQAMLAGSMIRWDSIAAKPKSYDENGKAIKPKDYER